MPTLIDCGKIPPLNAGDKLVHVNMSTSNSGPELTYVSSKDHVSGISTNGLTYCTAVTLVERDSNGTIQGLAMTHVNGGIDPGTLDKIMERSARDSFITSDIVVQFGIHEHPGNKERVETWLKSQKDYTCYSRENDTSSCITFSGYMGNFSYVHHESGPFVINEEALLKNMAANNPQAMGLNDVIIKINSYPCESSVKNKMYEYALDFYQAVVLKEISDFEKTKAVAHLQLQLNELSIHTSTRKEKSKPPLSENREDLSGTDDEDEIGFDGPSDSFDGPSEQQQEKSIACKMRAEIAGMRVSNSEPSSEDEEDEEDEEGIEFENPFPH